MSNPDPQAPTTPTPDDDTAEILRQAAELRAALLWFADPANSPAAIFLRALERAIETVRKEDAEARAKALEK